MFSLHPVAMASVQVEVSPPPPTPPNVVAGSDSQMAGATSEKPLQEKDDPSDGPR